MNRVTPHSAPVWRSENHSAAGKDANIFCNYQFGHQLSFTFIHFNPENLVKWDS